MNCEIECYVLLATKGEDEEWVKELYSLTVKEGEALGELIPHDCSVDSYLPSMRKAMVEWVATPSSLSRCCLLLTTLIGASYLALWAIGYSDFRMTSHGSIDLRSWHAFHW